MAVFDLGFLADRVRIFSLKDETANFLLGKSQVDYFLSQCSLLLVKRETWTMVSSVNFLGRHLHQKPTIQRRGQEKRFSIVVQGKTRRQNPWGQVWPVPLSGGTALGSHLLSLCLWALTEMVTPNIASATCLVISGSGHETEMGCYRWQVHRKYTINVNS